MRRGLWWRALSSVERGMANLTIRYVRNPTGLGLLNALYEIVNKLTDALRLGFYYGLDSIGRQIAVERVLIALSWGNEGARMWLEDINYIRFLGLNSRDFGGWGVAK